MESRSKAATADGGAGALGALMPLGVLRALVLVMLAFRLAFALLVPPNADESYYFLWGQHLQLSYLDHPGMIGWAERAGEALFGWTLFGLRMPTLAAAAATIALFWVWARKLSPESSQVYFWTLMGVYFCSPMFIFAGTNVLPDNWLILFLLFAAYFLSDFLGDLPAAGGSEVSWRNLYLGAFFMGLSGLCKYNALFFGLAFVAAMLSDSRWRGLFRAPQLYLAGGIVAFILSPILIWNVQNDFPTVALHSFGRYQHSNDLKSGFTFMGFLREGGAIAGFGPFLLPALYRFLKCSPGTGDKGALQALGRWSFVFSTGFMLALACWAPASRQVIMHWSDVSFIPFVVLAPLFCASPRLFQAHVVVGAVGFAVVAILYIFNPYPLHWLGRPPLEETRYGEDLAAATAARGMGEAHAAFIACPHWSEAAQLAFNAGSDRDIATYDLRENQFGIWRDEKTLVGKDAILVLRGVVAANEVREPFRSIEPYTVVTAQRFGKPISTYSLFVARGFIGYR